GTGRPPFWRCCRAFRRSAPSPSRCGRCAPASSPSRRPTAPSWRKRRMRPPRRAPLRDKLGTVTRPAARRPSPAIAAAMSGAVDLSSLKQPPAAPGASGGAPSGDHAVSEVDFEAKVLHRSMQVPVVVALYSQRSPGSVELVRTLQRMVEADGGKWALAAVEAEPNMRSAQALRVQGIPTVIAIAAGQPLADFEGAQPEPQVRQWIDAVVEA